MLACVGVSVIAALRLIVLLASSWWIFPWQSQPTPPPTSARESPQILRIDLSKSDIGGGDHVSGDVVTTPDVSVVRAIIVGQIVKLRRSRIGHFEIAFTVPEPVPFFFKGTQSVEFVALDAAGDKASRTVSFHVH